ncbi:52 kDa repressor of the inhibitor of the protein kinase-like [Diabrotica virgifera virgifera]|uniref:52 kDa repressor of the inhibitor of the protein kinase-like n=1 Tax=Diabrotica virgifera virgifera TaxID=50390 RepID=A0ABM5IWU8_DIAVI|nr:52 kDa repressor of the inhibitor of the protein kinase-like [Diabrotica virgifera virgifera]
MDIRKFFNKPNKRLTIDDGSDIPNSTENSSIVCSQNDLAIAGPSSLESAVSASQRETNVVTATASDNFAIVEDSLNLDVGNYLDTNKICSLNDRLKFTLLTNPWKPDKCYNFKYDIDDGKRPFIHEWLNTYPWLAYSKEVKGGLCKLCVLFRPRVTHGSYQSGFINRPFTNFRKFHENAKSHMNSEWHRQASENSSNFISVMKNEKKNVECLANYGLAKQIKSNRAKLKSIVSSILFSALHDLPLRGHTNEDAVFDNLLHFRKEAGDSVLEDHLKNAPKNAMYISHRTQNEIDLCATVLREELVTKINDNEIFSILADETMDITGTEQLSLGVRYFDKSENCIREDFLGFTPLKSLDAEHIANAITLTLTNWGLNLENAVGQGYDGCSTMAGEITGVHKRITEKYPKALYFHCASHRLNLVVNDLNDIPQIRNTTGTVKEVITFWQNGQRRAIVGTLQKLCETRWTEKYKAIRKFSEQFVSIAEALQTLSTEGNRDTRQKAFQLHCAVTNTAFVICLHVIAKYSAKLEIVTQMLQGVSVDILKISKHIQKVTELFSSDRQNGEKEFDNIMANVETTANKLGIELTCPRVAARQVHRPNHSTQTINEYYRKSIFLPYLDSLVQSLKDRFSDRNKPSFEIFNLHPKIMKDLSKEDFEKSINNINSTYCELLDNFKEQSILWFDLWKNTEIDAKALEKLNLIEVLEHEHACFLPSVAKAIQIALCLPPTTCTIERSFSTLKRVKTWIRNTMSKNHLSGLCLLSVHRRKIKENKENFMQKVIDLFAMDTRRIQLLFK